MSIVLRPPRRNRRNPPLPPFWQTGATSILPKSRKGRQRWIPCSLLAMVLHGCVAAQVVSAEGPSAISFSDVSERADGERRGTCVCPRCLPARPIRTRSFRMPAPSAFRMPGPSGLSECLYSYGPANFGAQRAPKSRKRLFFLTARSGGLTSSTTSTRRLA